MPAETFHSSHLAHEPGEITTASGIILPSEVRRKSNLKEEKISFDNLTGRSDKYTSAGVHPEDPYNAFALKQEIATDTESAAETHEKVLKQVTSELDSQDGEISSLREANDALQEKVETLERQVAELLETKAGSANTLTQPRRARQQNGVTENLVKNTDGSLNWQAADREDADAQFTQEAHPSQDTENIDEAIAEGDEVEQTEDSRTTSVVGSEPEPDRTLESSELEDQVEVAELEEAFEINLSNELREALRSAQDGYAEATAKNRNGFIGHYLHNSKFLTKIPGMQKMADRLNDWSDQKTLAPAREAYKNALVAIQEEIRSQMIAEYGADQETSDEIRINSMDVAIQSEADLEMKIMAARMEQSGKTNKLVNWWVRQDGLGGKFRKAGLVAGAGLTAGFVVGIAGAPLILGTLAGAGIGAGVGAYMTKKRASGITEKNGTQTLADQQRSEDLRRKQQQVAREIENEDGFVSASDFVALTEDRTGNEKVGNRRRLKTATTIGAAGGTAGAHLGELARAGIENLVSQQPDSTQPNRQQGPTLEAKQPEPQAPPAPELQGTSFDVSSGSSYTQELADFAQANGHVLSPDQSMQLHQDLVNQFGGDYIDINTPGNDVYVDAGDYRLMEPGSATWGDGVGPFIQQWMATRGLW